MVERESALPGISIPRDCKADMSFERLMEDGPGVEDGVALVSVMLKNEIVRQEMEMGSILGNHPHFYIGIRVTAA